MKKKIITVGCAIPTNEWYKPAANQSIFTNKKRLSNGLCIDYG